MTEQQYLAIRGRERNVARGPWYWKRCYEMHRGQLHWALTSDECEAQRKVLNGKLVLLDTAETWGDAPFDDDDDLRFLAHAREDIKVLLEEVERLWNAMPVRHLDIGQGGKVAVLQIVAILPFEGRAMKRLRDDAYQDGRLVDACKGCAARSMVITKSNHVVLSSVSADELLVREDAAE